MFEDIIGKAEDLLHDENMKGIVNKAKAFMETEKGKEVVENVKEKAEEFIKGHFGK